MLTQHEGRLTRALRADHERAHARRVAEQREAVRARAQTWRWSPEEAARRARQERRWCIGGFAVTGVDEGPLGAAGPAFSPYDEPGMLAWWNSENASLDGGDNVISYLDISGNGITATSASPGQRPATTFGSPDYGGKAMNDWVNVNNTKVDSDIINVGAYSLIQVCHLPLDVGVYFMSFSSGDYIYGATGVSTYTAFKGGGTGPSGWDAVAGAGWLQSATPQVFIKRFDGTHAGDTISFNGVLQPMSSVIGTDPGTDHINMNFTILNYSLGGFAVDGTWVTSLLYDHSVSDLVAAKLVSFFRTDYAI